MDKSLIGILSRSSKCSEFLLKDSRQSWTRFRSHAEQEETGRESPHLPDKDIHKVAERIKIYTKTDPYQSTPGQGVHLCSPFFLLGVSPQGELESSAPTSSSWPGTPVAQRISGLMCIHTRIQWCTFHSNHLTRVY